MEAAEDEAAWFAKHGTLLHGGDYDDAPPEPGEAPQRPQEARTPSDDTQVAQAPSEALTAPRRRLNRYAPDDASVQCGSAVCGTSGRHVHWYDCTGCAAADRSLHDCAGLYLGGMTDRGSTTGKLHACRCACLIKYPDDLTAVTPT